MFQRSFKRQKGFSLLELLFWAVVIGGASLVGMKTFPVYNEYWTVKRSMDKIVAQNPTTIADVQAAFEKQKEVEYSIVTIGPKDIKATRVGDRLVLSFSYSREVELIDPVYLLFKFSGQSK